MLRLALKMLYGDRAKYAMLICGLTFCSLLMIQQTSVFCGLMRWTTATVRNVGASIWVVDATVEQPNEIVPLRNIEVQRVRSVPGVDWAVPLYSGVLQARLKNGKFVAIQLTGIDSATLAGRPKKIVEGNINDLRLPNAVIVDQVAQEKFTKRGEPLKIGSVFEINDREALVVGLCQAERSFQGQPYIFTTYDRALDYAPPMRKMLAFVLAEPKPGVSAEEVARRIEALGGLKARTADALFFETINWYIKNTGIAISFGTVVIIGIIVGMAIGGQTFYLFVHDNLRLLAALKAMGAGPGTLAGMIFLQAFAVGFSGYGMGAGLAVLFASGALERGNPPFYMPWQVLVYSGVVILAICALSAFIGWWKVVRTEAAMVFR